MLSSENTGGHDYPTHALMMSVADGHAQMAEFTLQCWEVAPEITQATGAVEVPRINSIVDGCGACRDRVPAVSRASGRSGRAVPGDYGPFGVIFRLS